MGPDGEDVLVNGKGGRAMVGIGGYSLEGVEAVGEDAGDEAAEGEATEEATEEVVAADEAVDEAVEETGPAVAELTSARVYRGLVVKAALSLKSLTAIV